MNVLIIEDESSVAQNLCDLLMEINAEIKIIAILETVKDAVDWITEHPHPDLGFFDIRIADGNSFEIFEKVSVPFPIVFTTAFNEFALKAFKVNSIDYLIKPIKKAELQHALKKYETLYQLKTEAEQENLLNVIRVLKEKTPKKYKKSFLVYIKDKMIPIASEQIAYFHLDNELVYCYTHQNKKYCLHQALDHIQKQLDPDFFFRANRQFIVSRKAVKAAANYFHRKLKLEVLPNNQLEIMVSKPKVPSFKQWLVGTD